MANYLHQICAAIAMICLLACDRISDVPSSDAVVDAGADTGTSSQPVCCGCLCKDEQWSCSVETCVDDSGRAVLLGPESGYLGVDYGDRSRERTAKSKMQARVWYAFFPADEAPEDKPLAVFFQGGPGASVRILLGGNTAPRTLDRARHEGELVATNPHSWSSFANLLYLETARSGFSYVHDSPDNEEEHQEYADTLVPDYDAATFVRVILRFLARHPSLTDNPVISVGESYGGVRATLMLQQILEPASLENENAPYRDPVLVKELYDHFSRVFPTVAPEELKAADIARQFGHQVLIQPALLGDAQERHTVALNKLPPAVEALENARSTCLASSSVSKSLRKCCATRTLILVFSAWT